MKGDNWRSDFPRCNSVVILPWFMSLCYAKLNKHFSFNILELIKIQWASCKGLCFNESGNSKHLFNSGFHSNQGSANPLLGTSRFSLCIFFFLKTTHPFDWNLILLSKTASFNYVWKLKYSWELDEIQYNNFLYVFWGRDCKFV